MAYIATDKNQIAIYAIGETAQHARETALAEVGRLFDADGNELSHADALDQFHAYLATPALIAQVREQGGAIAWDYIDGTACAVDESPA